VRRLLPALALPGAFLLLSCGRVAVEDLPALAGKAKAGDPAAARALVKACGDPDHDLSRAAYLAVLEAGEKALPVLLEGVRSGQAPLFEASAAGVANLRARQAVPDLVAALAEGRRRALPAAWALGMIGDPAAIPPLVSALASPHPELRKAAVRALVRMGRQVEGAVMESWRARPGDPRAERAAIRVLGELSSKAAVPLLLAAGGENRDAAVWALGRIRDRSASESVREALRDPRWQVRREAAQALGVLGDRAGVPELRASLDDPEFVVREWAARSIMTITGEEILYRDEGGNMVPPYDLYR